MSYENTLPLAFPWLYRPRDREVVRTAVKFLANDPASVGSFAFTADRDQLWLSDFSRELLIQNRIINPLDLTDTANNLKRVRE